MAMLVLGRVNFPGCRLTHAFRKTLRKVNINGILAMNPNFFFLAILCSFFFFLGGGGGIIHVIFEKTNINNMNPGSPITTTFYRLVVTSFTIFYDVRFIIIQREPPAILKRVACRACRVDRYSESTFHKYVSSSTSLHLSPFCFWKSDTTSLFFPRKERENSRKTDLLTRVSTNT